MSIDTNMDLIFPTIERGVKDFRSSQSVSVNYIGSGAFKVFR